MQCPSFTNIFVRKKFLLRILSGSCIVYVCMPTCRMRNIFSCAKHSIIPPYTSSRAQGSRKKCNIFPPYNSPVQQCTKMWNLEKLYQALRSIPPTSVVSEQAFSISGSFVTKKRCRMSDDTLNDLCFLQGYFCNKNKKHANI